jgi:NADPH:quinone reductase-like Zn-dependent oxidoreductase
MKYKSVVVTKRGGLDALQIVENDLRPPAEGEARVKTLATPVCQDDIAVRVGNRPFLAKPPFVPGYSILGVVDAVGSKRASGKGTTKFAVGDRVAALTIFGGHAEYIYLPEEKLVHVPASLNPAEAVTLILNYLVAYQILHRVAQVKPDNKVLLVGSTGGVGTAFLQLGRLAGLNMYGLASPDKHKVLAKYGAVPIDYHTQDFVAMLRQTEPQGLDFVFNGMGEEYFERGLAVLHRGGVFVHYGGPQSFPRFLLLMIKFIGYNLLPNGKKIEGYGTHRLGVEVFKEDWAQLFKLLEEGKIKPIIAAKFPILEASKAYELFESGSVVGNVVLVPPDYL